jgi:hypothetical protein
MALDLNGQTMQAIVSDHGVKQIIVIIIIMLVYTDL